MRLRLPWADRLRYVNQEHMGFSIDGEYHQNRWFIMVYFMENHINMDDSGGDPHVRKPPYNNRFGEFSWNP